MRDPDTTPRSDTGANADSDTNGTLDTQTNARTDPNTGTGGKTNDDPNANSGANADSDTNSNVDPNANADTNTNADSDTNANTNANADSDTNANANADSRTVTTIVDSFSGIRSDIGSVFRYRMRYWVRFPISDAILDAFVESNVNTGSNAAPITDPTARPAPASTPTSKRPLRADGGHPPGSEGETPDSSDTHPGGDGETAEGPAEDHPMLRAYRHDAHKFRGRTHDNAAEWADGVRINQTVPRGADGDAAALSRPSTREPTLDNHTTPIRRSLRTGDPVALGLPRVIPDTDTDADADANHDATADADTGSDAGESEATTATLPPLLTITDHHEMHRAWLRAKMPTFINEDPCAPYTSLKYHTLLVAALLHNYRAGHAFSDLYLVVDPPPGDGSSITPGTDTDTATNTGPTIDTPPGTGTAGGSGPTETDTRGGSTTPREPIVSHRTIFASQLGCLRLTATPGDRPAAALGATPTRSFGDVWARLPAHPIGIGAPADTTLAEPHTISPDPHTTSPGPDTAETPTPAGESLDSDDWLDRRGAMMVDAQLRRIRSWSAALQYIEDYYEWWHATTRTRQDTHGGDGL